MQKISLNSVINDLIINANIFNILLRVSGWSGNWHRKQTGQMVRNDLGISPNGFFTGE
jgi:hypothetical protein